MCGQTKQSSRGQIAFEYKGRGFLFDIVSSNFGLLFCVYSSYCSIKLGSALPCVGEVWPLGSIVFQKNVGTGLCQCLLMGRQQYVLRNCR